MSNRYNGKCNHCGCAVAAGAGHCEFTGRPGRDRYQVLCNTCFDKSDNSSYEDRCCGDRAYEDRCAEACGY